MLLLQARPIAWDVAAQMWENIKGAFATGGLTYSVTGHQKVLFAVKLLGANFAGDLADFLRSVLRANIQHQHQWTWHLLTSTMDVSKHNGVSLSVDLWLRIFSVVQQDTDRAAEGAMFPRVAHGVDLYQQVQMMRLVCKNFNHLFWHQPFCHLASTLWQRHHLPQPRA